LERANSANCLVTEYTLGDAYLDFAKIVLTGRYPDQGRVVNHQCKEVVYVAKGQGSITIEDVIHSLSEGDVVLVEAGERYFWEGHMTLCISCHPAFNLAQHQAVA
jgi:hypothetical protein